MSFTGLTGVAVFVGGGVIVSRILTDDGRTEDEKLKAGWGRDGGLLQHLEKTVAKELLLRKTVNERMGKF